ncbi:MAG TPA: hypothetical protein VF510_20120 [Ktedonobacterales bacterium]
MNQLVALGGAMRYEFLMQARRVSAWVACALLAALNIAIVNANVAPRDVNLPANVTRYNLVLNLTGSFAYLLTLGAGLLLAGRYRRDFTLKVDEMLQTTPASGATRLLGKYLGGVLATLMPLGVSYFAGVAVLVARWHDVGILPLTLASFALRVVPPVLFVAAFSIACTTVLWPPLFQFIFVGFMLWITLDPAGPIPTLDGTVLSPLERLVDTGIFHFAPFRTGDLSYYPRATVWLGIANIAALLGVGLLALAAAWRIDLWRVGRR